MNTFTIFYVVCLAIACACAATVPASQPEASKPAEAPVAKEGDRTKRFFPIAAYSAPAFGTVSGYSYLAPYANSGKIVHYPPPVISSYAAVPAISTYHAIPAVSTYAAAPLSFYHHF